MRQQGGKLASVSRAATIDLSVAAAAGGAGRQPPNPPLPGLLYVLAAACWSPCRGTRSPPGKVQPPTCRRPSAERPSTASSASKSAAAATRPHIVVKRGGRRE